MSRISIELTNVFGWRSSDLDGVSVGKLLQILLDRKILNWWLCVELLSILLFVDFSVFISSIWQIEIDWLSPN